MGKSEVLSISRIVRSPIPWVGGKGYLLDDIQEMSPTDCTRYVEPFGGGATVLLSMPQHKFEAYNDYNSNLVNMFRCIKERPLSFIRTASLFPLNSRHEFNIIKDFLERKEPDFSNIDREIGIAHEVFTELDAKDIEKILTGNKELYDVERAVMFYKLIRYSYSGTGKSFGGQPVNLPNMLEHIYAISKRLSNVVIENKDFEEFIVQQDKPGTFMYMDPPYYMTEDFYTGFERKDHIRLYECIVNLKYAKVLLSYNDSEFVKELYNQYTIVETSRLHSMAQRYDAGSRFGEVFIANYDVNERKKKRPQQLCLLGDEKYYERDYWQDYRIDRPNSHIFYISKGLQDIR